MSEEKMEKEGLPAAEPAPEEMTLQTLWTEYARPVLVWVLLAAVLVLGWSAWRSHRENLAAEESAALFQANTAEDLRNLALAARNPATAAAAWSMAAAGFESDARYEDALEAYRTLEADYAGNDLAQTAALGIANCQEALGDPAAAAATLDAWLAANPGHFAARIATLDAIRAYRLAGDFATARVRGEDWKVAHPDDAMTAARIDDALALVAQAERAAAQPAPAVEAVEVPAEDAADDEPVAEDVPADEPEPEAPAAESAE